VKVQIFEEAAGTALGQDHTLCIFKRTCGDVPVIEHNGDFFPVITSSMGTPLGEHQGDVAGRSHRRSGTEGIRPGQTGHLTPLLPGV